MTENQLIDRFVHAWAKAEGFFDKRKIATVSQRLHNPCNLPRWRDSNNTPYPEVCGLVEFPDEQTGFAAAASQARTNIFKSRLTFMEFFAGKRMVWRGACPRDEARQFSPTSYAGAVARSMPGSPHIHVVIASLILPQNRPERA